MQLMRSTCEWGHSLTMDKYAHGRNHLCLAERSQPASKAQMTDMGPVSFLGHSCYICLEECDHSCMRPCRTCIGSTSRVHKACFAQLLCKTQAVLCPQCHTPLP